MLWVKERGLWLTSEQAKAGANERANAGANERANKWASEWMNEHERTSEQGKFQHAVHSEVLRKFHLSAASALIKHLLSAFHVTWFFSLIASRRNAKSSLSLRSPSSSSNGVSSMALKHKKIPLFICSFFVPRCEQGQCTITITYYYYYYYLLLLATK